MSTWIDGQQYKESIRGPFFICGVTCLEPLEMLDGTARQQCYLDAQATMPKRVFDCTTT